MTKTELIAAIANSAGVSRDQAKKSVEVFTDAVTASLKAGKDVRLVGFGAFVPVERKAGVARNPRTGEAVSRPASKSVRFRVGEGLKSALNA